MKFHRVKGFSMIELMIVVAIVGILAAIVVPSYRSSMIKGSRTAVQTELMKLASLQEKIYLNSSAYACNAVATAYNGNSTGGLGVGTSDDGKYTFALSACATNTYTITAVPVAGSNQVGDGCLSIQENGLRQWYQGHDNCTGTAIAW
ncbi:MAG: prepilin-type N-terminal cleavage/methylation domain-containing protein [Nitrosomonadales bacterium]|nr:prepilin-type N-terminal cleavage/methylation domain-containing protein [Nitrosomonadales bacterium]